MLSLLACYSMYAIIPVYIGLACFGKEDVLTRRRSKYRLRLWIVLVSVILLAIDFAVTRYLHFPNSSFPLYALNAGVVLIPLIYGMLAKHTILALWSSACLVGLVGMLSLPGVAAH